MIDIQDYMKHGMHAAQVTPKAIQKWKSFFYGLIVCFQV